MTPLEAGHLLVIMAAPHHWDVDPDTSEVWYQAALERTDYSLGMDVAMHLVETYERFPTPAMFNAARHDMERKAYLATRPELPPVLPPPDPQEASEWIAAMKAMLATQKDNLRKHWHGGPNPCPVCGGMKPVGW